MLNKTTIKLLGSLFVPIGSSKASSLLRIPAELFLPVYPPLAMSHLPRCVHSVWIRNDFLKKTFSSSLVSSSSKSLAVQIYLYWGTRLVSVLIFCSSFSVILYCSLHSSNLSSKSDSFTVFFHYCFPVWTWETHEADHRVAWKPWAWCLHHLGKINKWDKDGGCALRNFLSHSHSQSPPAMRYALSAGWMFSWFCFSNMCMLLNLKGASLKIGYSTVCWGLC